MADIVLIEDDLAILQGVQQLLGQAGFVVRSAMTGKEAKTLLSTSPDLIILDVMLPDTDGFELCRQIRLLPQYIPVLMLTACAELKDKVLGLEQGADEYVTKPFEPLELLARIRAILRFSAQKRQSLEIETVEQPLVYGPLQIWRKRHYAEINGLPLELTPTEWSLLEFFSKHPRQVFGRETLLEKIWGVDYQGDSRAVDTAVQRLRTKLEADLSAPRFIQTVRGFGYRFVNVESSRL